MTNFNDYHTALKASKPIIVSLQDLNRDGIYDVIMPSHTLGVKHYVRKAFEEAFEQTATLSDQLTKTDLSADVITLEVLGQSVTFTLEEQLLNIEISEFNGDVQSLGTFFFHLTAVAGVVAQLINEHNNYKTLTRLNTLKINYRVIKGLPKHKTFDNPSVITIIGSHLTPYDPAIYRLTTTSLATDEQKDEYITKTIKNAMSVKIPHKEQRRTGFWKSIFSKLH